MFIYLTFYSHKNIILAISFQIHFFNSKRWRSSSASGSRNEDGEKKLKDKKARRSLVFETDTGSTQKVTAKAKKSSLKDKKKKSKDRDKLKNVGFVETNEHDLDDADTKSIRSLCFVIDTEKDTLSVISGKYLSFLKVSKNIH